MPGEDGRVRVGDRNYTTTRTTEESKTGDGHKEMMRRPGTAAPPHPQRGTAANGNSVGPQQRHSDSADGTRPKNGMKLRRKYGILASDEPAGNPATAGPRVIGSSTGPQGERHTRSG